MKIKPPKLVGLNEYIASSNPWALLDPINDNLYPSIVKDYFNDGNRARFFVSNNYVLGELHRFGEQPFWTLSSNKTLGIAHIEEAEKIVRNVDPSFSDIRMLSRNNIEDLKETGQWEASPEPSRYYPYIYDVQATKEMQGRKYASLRRQVNKFNRLYSDQARVVSYTAASDLIPILPQIEALFSDWLLFGNHTAEEIEGESLGFGSFLSLHFNKTFRKPLVIAIFYGPKLVGISVNDLVSPLSAINIYQFSNLNLEGISYYMFHLTAELLHQRGITTLNFQEDCGNKGLAEFKQRLSPILVPELYKLRF